MKAFLLLGRYGDITTLLPLLRQQAEASGQPTPVVCAADYAPLLEGVSYARAVVFPGHFSRPMEARAWGMRQLQDHALIDCSVYGVNVPNEMWSFDREIWHRARADFPFASRPPIFDRRSPAREQALWDRVAREQGVTGLPVVLAALHGTSSPFAAGPEFLIQLRAALSAHCDVINLDLVRAERPYDLLGLYERAQGLVAIDSFPLHLAAAVPALATAALITDGPTPWHRSAWRPHHLIRRLYSEALGSMDSIAGLMRTPRPGPRLLLVTSSGPVTDPSIERRLKISLESRRSEFAMARWSGVPFTAGRDGTMVRDRPVPFVRDMIAAAEAATESDDDVIVVVNADIGFVPGISGLILEAVSRHGACFAHRWDANSIPRSNLTEYEVGRCRWYPGSDLFAFTRRFWRQHGGIFPDMLLGREAWDMVMRNLIKRAGGGEIHKCIWHERHRSLWEHQPRLPGNEHNRRLATQWLSRYGGSWNDWEGPQKYRG